MSKGKMLSAVALTTAAMLTISGCGGGASDQKSNSDAFDNNAKTEITLAGWSTSQDPTFANLIKEFNTTHPNVTISIKEYNADDYDKLLTADISAGSQPDVIPIKNFAKYYTYATESGGFADISDIANQYKGDSAINTSAFKVDGKYFGLPYRQDSWVLYYNKDMFDKAGVKTPDGTWTWDDYTKTAEELKKKLPEAGYDAASVFPTYQHNWQTVVQSFAYAQGGKDTKADFLKADFNYMKPFYKRALQWQNEGLTIDWSTSNATKVQYQAQFGTQKAAMLPMGTWFVSTFLSQIQKGDAQKFNWGIAPIPQNSKADTTKAPKTFGDPTGMAISSKAKGQKLAAAKEFVKWITSEKGSIALAKAGNTPAYFSKAVEDAFFSVKGTPQDALSKEAWVKHDISLQSPSSGNSAAIVDILSDAHSSIMTKSQSVDEALANASKTVKEQGLTE